MRKYYHPEVDVVKKFEGWGGAEEYLLKDKYIGPLVKKWGRCKIKKRAKRFYFEDLVASIVEQQLSGKAAEVIFSRVRKLLKKKSPTPLSPISQSDVAKVKEKDLRACGISWSKASYVKDLGIKVDGGVVNLEKLDKLSDKEIIIELVQVKGIGQWTAEMFLMFTLARPDVFPVDDLGIRKGFEKVTNKKFAKIKSEKFAEKYWKPYRTVASWYLWRSLEN